MRDLGRVGNLGTSVDVLYLELISKDDDSYSVGQNIMYLDEFPRDEWEIKIVRSWYLQGNTIDATVLEDYRDVKWVHLNETLYINNYVWFVFILFFRTGNQTTLS